MSSLGLSLEKSSTSHLSE